MLRVEAVGSLGHQCYGSHQTLVPEDGIADDAFISSSINLFNASIVSLFSCEFLIIIPIFTVLFFIIYYYISSLFRLSSIIFQ